MPSFSSTLIREVIPKFGGEIGYPETRSGWQRFKESPMRTERDGIWYPDLVKWFTEFEKAPRLEINPYRDMPIEEVTSKIMAEEPFVEPFVEPTPITEAPRGGGIRVPEFIPPLELPESRLAVSPTFTPSAVEPREESFWGKLLGGIKEEFSMENLTSPGFVSQLGALGAAIAGGEGTIGGELGQHAQMMARTHAYTKLLDSLTTGGRMPDARTLSALTAEDVSSATQIARETIKTQKEMESLIALREQQKLESKAATAEYERKTRIAAQTKEERLAEKAALSPQEIMAGMKLSANIDIANTLRQHKLGQLTDESAVEKLQLHIADSPAATNAAIKSIGGEPLTTSEWNSALRWVTDQSTEAVEISVENMGNLPATTKGLSEVQLKDVENRRYNYELQLGSANIAQRIVSGRAYNETEKEIYAALISRDENPMLQYTNVIRYSDAMSYYMYDYAQRAGGQAMPPDVMEKLSAIAYLASQGEAVQDLWENIIQNVGTR